MKIEISLKDLILFFLILFTLMFSIITFIDLQNRIEFAEKVNQINRNSENIQLLDKVIGQMRQQNVPAYDLTPKKK